MRAARRGSQTPSPSSSGGVRALTPPGGVSASSGSGGGIASQGVRVWTTWAWQLGRARSTRAPPNSDPPTKERGGGKGQPPQQAPGPRAEPKTARRSAARTGLLPLPTAGGVTELGGARAPRWSPRQATRSSPLPFLLSPPPRSAAESSPARVKLASSKRSREIVLFRGGWRVVRSAKREAKLPEVFPDFLHGGFGFRTSKENQ